MNLSKKIVLSLSIAAVTSVIIFVLSKRSCNNQMLSRISDEGYETAQDVLFPGRNIKDKHLHFGPVLPE